MSLACFALAPRHLATVRAGAYFSTTLFVGAAVPFMVFRERVLTAASGGLLLAGLAAHAALADFRAAVLEGGDEWPLAVATTLYALSVFAGVWTVLPKAWIAARGL